MKNTSRRTHTNMKSCTPMSSTSIMLLIGALVVSVLLFTAFMKRKSIEKFFVSSKVVFYYMTGCPHCVDAEPEWDKFVEKAKAAGISTDKVESKDPQASKAGVTSFPTFIFTKDGKDTVYNGDRTADAFMAFANK
ncbi:MAG: hypothetical protein EB127_15935 [Alphaproteobacteria bacterium]|nr:hypothetical protein [Alphaproteobacteria bacterium]